MAEPQPKIARRLNRLKIFAKKARFYKFVIQKSRRNMRKSTFELIPLRKRRLRGLYFFWAILQPLSPLF
ncbi:MAG: hypothetical protein A3G70_01895 [Planctomycetes bacterium RIFCSPLOWO2_12_FULL_39_13]|nr:MAG: hypothetical protein A2Y09_11025 [Planctomycetes bacterium GWA2_39_15]OHC01168.1 MAG: hypothetical protein A3G70_01895 [Planctomycetes bacterium RIFCSPLOWO2_12_FULL_39_13]